MKRIFAFLLMLVLTFSSLPALARDPSPISTIPYEEIPENRPGLHHYLLLCLDQWSGNIRKNHTDGILLLSLDTRTNRIMLTSFTRDSIVKRPDHYGRINKVVMQLGPEALCQIISTHLGIKVEKYVVFDFQQIANIVDYMGGVPIEVNALEAKYLCDYPLDPWQTEPPMERAGTYHFTGRAAVIYMRIRKADKGGDFMRTQRVRTVLSTLADMCRNITWEQAQNLLDSVMTNSTQTNMSASDLAKALEQAYELRTCTIEELRLPIDGSYQAITWVGMNCQDIDWEVNRAAMAKYLDLRNDAVIDDKDDENPFID